jgi:hypothetical protein
LLTGVALLNWYWLLIVLWMVKVSNAHFQDWYSWFFAITSLRYFQEILSLSSWYKLEFSFKFSHGGRCRNVTSKTIIEAAHENAQRHRQLSCHVGDVR